MEDSAGADRRVERGTEGVDAAGAVPQEIDALQDERFAGAARRRFPLRHGHRVRPAVHQLSEALRLHERSLRLVR